MTAHASRKHIDLFPDASTLHSHILRELQQIIRFAISGKLLTIQLLYESYILRSRLYDLRGIGRLRFQHRCFEGHLGSNQRCGRWVIPTPGNMKLIAYLVEDDSIQSAHDKCFIGK